MFSVRNDNLTAKTSMIYIGIDGPQTNKPWLVLQTQWGSVPAGASFGIIACGGEFAAFIYKLNNDFGSAIMHTYNRLVYKVTLISGTWVLTTANLTDQPFE
mgnify:FL=1